MPVAAARHVAFRFRVSARVAKRYRLMQAMSMGDALTTLGFPPGADPDKNEVMRAWKQRIFEEHPDRGGDPEKARDLNVARDVLLGKQRATYDGPVPGGGAGDPGAGWAPPPAPDPVVVTWEEAASGIPTTVEWKFKTSTAFSGYGDTHASGYVVYGQKGKNQHVFVAVEHYRHQNAFTGEDVSKYWMESMTASGSLRDVAPKAIRQLWAKFPHLKKKYNAKVQLLPEGTSLKDTNHFRGRNISFKDAMEIMGELGEGDPWKNRKLKVQMFLTRDYGAQKDGIEIVVNGRTFKLSDDSVDFIKNKTKVLRAVFGDYYYFSDDRKDLTRSKAGEKVMRYLSEKLTREPQELRDALAAAADQKGKKRR